MIEISRTPIITDRMPQRHLLPEEWLLAETIYDARLVFNRAKIEYRTEELNPKDKERLRRAESIGRQLLRDKVTALGISAEFIDELPSPTYTKGYKIPWWYSSYYSQDGAYVPEVDMIKAPVDPFERDVLSIAITASGHELFHASGKRRVVRDFTQFDPSQKKLKIHSHPATGVEFIEDTQVKGKGLENGLAYMQERDLYVQLRELSDFSREVKKRRRVLRIPTLDVHLRLAVLAMSRFGLLDAKSLESFIKTPESRIYRVFRTAIDIEGIKSLRLVEEICKVLGHTELGNGATTEEKITHGRAILERDHFTASGEAINKIREIFGQKTAEAIFKIDDQNNFKDKIRKNKAMRLIKKRERQLGII